LTAFGVVRRNRNRSFQTELLEGSKAHPIPANVWHVRDDAARTRRANAGLHIPARNSITTASFNESSAASYGKSLATGDNFFRPPGIVRRTEFQLRTAQRTIRMSFGISDRMGTRSALHRSHCRTAVFPRGRRFELIVSSGHRCTLRSRIESCGRRTLSRHDSRDCPFCVPKLATTVRWHADQLFDNVCCIREIAP
jgi:hypothetical protein